MGKLLMYALMSSFWVVQPVHAQEMADSTIVNKGKIAYITFEYSENGAMVLKEPGTNQDDEVSLEKETNNRKTRNHISMVPDPVTGLPTNIVNIDLRDQKQSQNTSFSVHTVSGAEVLNTKMSVQHQQYDLSKLPPGIYLLTLTFNKKKETLKFIHK